MPDPDTIVVCSTIVVCFGMLLAMVRYLTKTIEIERRP